MVQRDAGFGGQDPHADLVAVGFEREHGAGHDDPALSSSSSTSYSHTAWAVISAGNLNPFYDTAAPVPTASPPR